MSVEWHKLGEYIERIERPNADGKYGVEDVRGVSNTKLIQKTKASMDGRDFTPFTVLNPREFVFNRRTTRNGERLGLGFNQDDRPYIFTEDYVAFRVRDVQRLLPEFLYVLFLRDEFDRYARFNSWGSARETFNWADMCRVKIPLPPLEVLQAIVDVYRCANEAKKIEAEADRLSREICPALIRATGGAAASNILTGAGDRLGGADLRNTFTGAGRGATRAREGAS